MENTTIWCVVFWSYPDQIEWALNDLPSTKHLKLYNKAEAFDKNAIPEKDYLENCPPDKRFRDTHC
jgi:hypothetical protein